MFIGKVQMARGINIFLFMQLCSIRFQDLKIVKFAGNENKRVSHERKKYFCYRIECNFAIDVNFICDVTTTL